MKKIVTTTAIVICSLLSFGQSEEVYDKIIKEAPFVFEGKVIEQVYFVDTTNFDKPYTANIVQISKIFRGGKDIKVGTISIVTEGGMIESNGMIFSSGEPSHQKGWAGMGIYFCFPVNSTEMGHVYPSSGKIIQGKTQNKSFDNDNSMSLKSLGVIDTWSRGGMGRNFKNRQEMYDFLSKYESITIPKEEKKTEPVKEKYDDPPLKKKMLLVPES